MTKDRLRILAWQVLILVAVLAGWQYLTGIKAISKTPGLYWIDPFFISRPSAIAERFVYLMSPKVRLGIWVRRGDEDRCAHAMRSLKTAMRDEDTEVRLNASEAVLTITAPR